MEANVACYNSWITDIPSKDLREVFRDEPRRSFLRLAKPLLLRTKELRAIKLQGEESAGIAEVLE